MLGLALKLLHSMKILILISVVTLLGGCMMWTDPTTGNFRAQTVFQPLPDPESMVPRNISNSK
jgi:hypothetical protein